MRDNEKIFLSLVEKGVFEIKENGKIFRVKKSHKEWDGEFRDCKPKLLGSKTKAGYIRISMIKKGFKRSEVAEKFKVSVSTIFRINHKKSWKYV